MKQKTPSSIINLPNGHDTYKKDDQTKLDVMYAEQNTSSDVEITVLPGTAPTRGSKVGMIPIRNKPNR